MILEWRAQLEFSSIRRSSSRAAHLELIQQRAIRLTPLRSPALERGDDVCELQLRPARRRVSILQSSLPLQELHRIQTGSAQLKLHLDDLPLKRGKVLAPLQPLDFRLHEITIDIDAIISAEAWDRFSVFV